MLILAILLFFSVLRQSDSINLTYIVNTEETRLSCVAEESVRYLGVGWTYPIREKEHDLPNITTRFLPAIHNAFNCKFSDDDKCNKFWAIKNWNIVKNSSRIYDLILDDRWEDFPTIFTAESKKSKEGFEIPNVFNIGLSVRASNETDILVCEGWNPHNYPCYQIQIAQSQIFFRKYMTLPKATSSGDIFLDKYQTFSNILSEDEWRNFIVSYSEDGVLQLVDVNVNRTAINYKDDTPLKPLYLLVRSLSPALWKIHKNQFIYTETQQVSRLGPVLSLPSKDLCVTLFVSTCSNCEMSFLIMKNNIRKVLKKVKPSEEYKWRPIKLKEENILSEKVTIFVETSFTDPLLSETKGFWAIDSVRVCHENEVKVTVLKFNNGSSNGYEDDPESFSCQVIEQPKWRPRKLVYPKVIDDAPVIKNITSHSSSINIHWSQEDPRKQISYFITYEANDICTSEPFNLKRMKSKGFLATKFDEMEIANLVPYTKYNITLSSMLHDKEKTIFVTTEESDTPTSEELPNRVQVQVTEDVAYVSWDKVECSNIYGHLFYALKLTNNVLNVSEDLKVQTENTVEIKNLQPFTSYTLNILTARSFENIENSTDTLPMIIPFKTKAGVAPPVRTLELYSIDKNSASFRYDLPDNIHGIPVEIQIMRCNPILFKKCKPSHAPIKRCPLWTKKYCFELEGLIPYQRHTFKVSIKNSNTNAFGDEVVVDGFTQEQVPAPPTNLTYTIVDCKESLDYCNLNVSWLHPYAQNGTITSFHIELNSSTSNNVTETIPGVLKVENKTYHRQYEYQFQFMPYSKHYELYVRSVNEKFKSDFVTIHLKTADIGDHIDQEPVFSEVKNNSAVFKLWPVDFRLKSYTLKVVVQDFNNNVSVPPEIVKQKDVSDHLCHKFGNTWISQVVEITNATENITVGRSDPTKRLLEFDTQYCVTFIITNKYRDTEHEVVYYKKFQTPAGLENINNVPSGASSYNHLYVLLLILLVIPIGFFAYRYIKKKKTKKPVTQENLENVYESLPFEECENNCVSNENYDHLLHK